MANTASARKNVQKSNRRTLVNVARKTAIKTAIKKALSAIDGGSADKEQINALLSDVAAQLARAQSKGLLHKNTVARRMSRIARRASRIRA